MTKSLLFSKKELQRKGGLLDQKHFRKFNDEKKGICVCILMTKIKEQEQISFFMENIKIIPYENLNLFLNQNKNKFTHYTYKKWLFKKYKNKKEEFIWKDYHKLKIREQVEKFFISIKLYFEKNPSIHPIQLHCWKTTNNLKNQFDLTKKDLNQIAKEKPEIKIIVGNTEFWHFQTFIKHQKLYTIFTNRNWIYHYYQKICE